MTERWITDEDEPLLIVDSKGEYESISVLYREDAPTVRGLLNDYDEKYIDEFSLRETLQLEVQRLEKENEQLKQHIDFADKLIDDLGHNEMKRQWEEYE